VRTTINLQDHLLMQAKQVALSENNTLGGVIEDALREFFARRNRTAGREKTKLPTYRGAGLQPGVDLNSTASLLDRMEDR
jgi:hypothetical protein